MQARIETYATKHEPYGHRVSAFAFLSTNQNKMFKPFRPPLLKSVPKPSKPVDEFSDVQVISDSEEEILTKPAAKKRRLLIHNVEEAPKIKAPITSSAANAPRKPLMVVKNPVEATQAPTPSENPSSIDGYYLVLW